MGRSSRSGPLDDLTLNAGRWPSHPGDIALAVYAPFQAPVGTKVTVTSASGKPKLAVVGYAGSIARDEAAWVLPSEIAALRPRGAPREAEMLFTFRHAGTATQMNANLEALEAALPPGAIMSSISWLLSEEQTNAEQSINTPFAVAFGLIALLLSVLIVASVVSGAVVAGYRRIGILKSIGFTPGQVTAAYVAQVGVPTVAGCVVGAILGNRWVEPLLVGVPGGGSAHTLPTSIELGVPVGLCALVGLAASIPALRAGRLSAVAAIAQGSAPSAGHGYVAHRLLGKLRLPRPVTIGLAAPFARPARSALTLAAIMFAVAAVTVAVGLNSSLTAVNQTAKRGQGDVQVTPSGSTQSFTARQQRAVAAALSAQAGTLRYAAVGSPPPGGFGSPQTINVSKLQFPLNVTAYAGQSAWLGWDLISGRWYSHPGEIDVNSNFLRQTGLAVGDAVHLTANGHAVDARIVGQVFVPNLPSLFTSWQTLGGASAGLTISQYAIDLRPGIAPHTYEQALGRALGPNYAVTTPSATDSTFGTIDTALIRLLTVIVAVLAALGVLNSVLMVTRERVHDLGVFKALGMTPRQTILMVICWVVAPALIASAIAIPTAIILHDITLHAIGRTQGTGIPSNIINVYTAPELLVLALCGLAIAAAGAVLPASWAAASATATALQTE